MEKTANEVFKNSDFPMESLSDPLAANLLPYIDSEMEDGKSREEWKAETELNKIMNLNNKIPVDGICVRVPVFRCHSQALTIKLKKDIEVKEIEKILDESSEWINVIPNNKKETLNKLTPAAVSGSLNIHVGRIRKMSLGNEYLTMFTVGDQLLWGAAEPLRRMLNLLLD